MGCMVGMVGMGWIDRGSWSVEEEEGVDEGLLGVRSVMLSDDEGRSPVP